jgi:hypothetical protein
MVNYEFSVIGIVYVIQTGGTSGAGPAYHSGAPEFTPASIDWDIFK